MSAVSPNLARALIDVLAAIERIRVDKRGSRRKLRLKTVGGIVVPVVSDKSCDEDEKH